MSVIAVFFVSWVGFLVIGLALWAGACEWHVRRERRRGGVGYSAVTGAAATTPGDPVPPPDRLEERIFRPRMSRCLECGEEFEPIVYAGEEELVCMGCTLDRIVRGAA